MTMIGPYRLLRNLGTSEAGQVWSAFAEDGSTVTIAMIDPARAADPAWLNAVMRGVDGLVRSGQLTVVGADLSPPRPWVACAWDDGIGAGLIFTAGGLAYHPVDGPAAAPVPGTAQPVSPQPVSPQPVSPSGPPRAAQPLQPAQPVTPPSGPTAVQPARTGDLPHRTPQPAPSGQPAAPTSPGFPAQPAAPGVPTQPASAAQMYPGGSPPVPIQPGYPGGSAPGSSGASPWQPPAQPGPGAFAAAQAGQYQSAAAGTYQAAGPQGAQGAPGAQPGSPAQPAWATVPAPVRPKDSPTMEVPLLAPQSKSSGAPWILITAIVVVVLLVAGGVVAWQLKVFSGGPVAAPSPTPSPTPPPSGPGIEPPQAGQWPSSWPRFGSSDQLQKLTLGGVGFTFRAPPSWKCTQTVGDAAGVVYSCGAGSIGGEIEVHPCVDGCDDERRVLMRGDEDAWGQRWTAAGPRVTWAQTQVLPNPAPYGLIVVAYWHSKPQGAIDRQIVLRLRAPRDQTAEVQKVANEVYLAIVN